MYELTLDHNSPLSIATYDPISGELYLEFNYDRLLDTQGEWSKGRHIDAVTFMGEAYPIIIHADDGPRDANGHYIFDRDTVDNIFTLDVGTGHDLTNGTLEFGLSDREDGTGPLYSFVLEDAGASTPQTYELTPTADDGVVTVNDFSQEDTISIAGDSFEYDFDSIVSSAMAQRALSADVDTDYVVDDEGNAQVLLFTNSQPEGEVASFDELFAVVNVTGEDTEASGVIDLGDQFIDPVYIDENGVISHEAPNEVIEVDIPPVNEASKVIDLGDQFILPIYIDEMA